MATIKATLFRSAKKDGTHAIKIKIGHRSSFAELSTKYSISPEHWKNERIASKCPEVPNARMANNDIAAKINQAWDIVDQLTERNIIHTLTAKQLRDYIANGGSTTNRNVLFIDYYEKTIKRHYTGGTLKIYERTLKVLKNYQPTDVFFSDINKAWLHDFKMTRLQESSAATTTIDLRNIRAVFNIAIDIDEVVEQSMYPFRKFEFPNATPRNLRLPLDTIRAIRDYETENPSLIKARDFFMLSFYLVGMNTTDIYHLTKDSFVDGYVNYTRKKTKKFYSIRLEPEAAAIFEKYKGKVKLTSFQEEYRKAENVTKKINEYLKVIGTDSKINVPDLKVYHARHSWAGAAGRKPIGATKYQVAQALGHGRTTVTDTYYDEDWEVVADLNRKVLDLLKKA